MVKVFGWIIIVIELCIIVFEDVFLILFFFKRFLSFGLFWIVKMFCLMDWLSLWWFEYFRKREEFMFLLCWLNDNEGFVKLKRVDEDNLKRDDGVKKMRFLNRWERMSSILFKYSSVIINFWWYFLNIFYFYVFIKFILFVFYVK